MTNDNNNNNNNNNNINNNNNDNNNNSNNNNNKASRYPIFSQNLSCCNKYFRKLSHSGFIIPSISLRDFTSQTLFDFDFIFFIMKNATKNI